MFANGIDRLEFQSPMSNRAQRAAVQDANMWLLRRNMKAFCNLVQEHNFFQGVRSMIQVKFAVFCLFSLVLITYFLIQSSGIGKLRPNIIMLGFKTDWTESEHGRVSDYFKTIQYAIRFAIQLFNCFV